MSKQWIDNRRTIAVDWNGVLDLYTGYSHGKLYEPRPGAKEFLHKLAEAGYKVVVMTAADPEVVRNWLIFYEMDADVHMVTGDKIPAIVYLDDRAVTFTGDFDAAFAAIETFKTFWETSTNMERK